MKMEKNGFMLHNHETICIVLCCVVMRYVLCCDLLIRLLHTLYSRLPNDFW